MASKESVKNSASTENILEIEDATVTFGMERGQSRVLNEVNLDIRKEETLGVVGESGSGKSMLASSILNAVVDPGQLTGEITYYPTDQESVDILSLNNDELKEIRWNGISFIIQAAQSAFNPTMTVQGHFVDTLREHDADVHEGLKRAHNLMTDLYLNPEQVFDSYPHELSGGMKQRALIALALVLEPDVLVMDEPTAALDLLMQRSIISLLHELKQKYELTLIFITHDLSLVSDLADRLAVMYAFEVVEIGPTTDILHQPAHPYTRALLNSVPNITTPDEKMKPISGSSPDPINVPSGCSYHPRCPLADDQCETSDPELQPVEPSHRAACFYPEQATQEIPLNITEENP